MKKPKPPIVWQIERTHPSWRNPNGVLHLACYRGERRIHAYRMEPADAFDLARELMRQAQKLESRSLCVETSALPDVRLLPVREPA